MGRVRALARLGRANARLVAILFLLAASARTARAFSGTVRYDGALGPVTPQRPLCLCFFANPQLTSGLGCYLYGRNDVGYQVQLGESRQLTDKVIGPNLGAGDGRIREPLRDDE